MILHVFIVQYLWSKNITKYTGQQLYVVCFLSKQVNPSLQSIKKKEGKIDCILRPVLPTSNFLLWKITDHSEYQLVCKKGW